MKGKLIATVKWNEDGTWTVVHDPITGGEEE
jgi:hypothetical protein